MFSKQVTATPDWRPEGENWVLRASPEIVVLRNPLSHAAEAIRSVQSQLQRQFIDRGIRSFAIVGDDSKCGSSLIAANIAVSCAQAGRRTALVDANLKDPQQFEIFGFSPSDPGLAEWLMCSDFRVNRNKYGHQSFPNLTVIPAGLADAHEPLQNPRLVAVIAQLSRIFDAVIYDAPPASDLANALAIAGAVERTFLVGREHRTRVSTLQQLHSLVEQCHGKVEGVILSRF
jgi:Mrp family chromosome partitioning ATPase